MQGKEVILSKLYFLQFTPEVEMLRVARWNKHLGRVYIVRLLKNRFKKLKTQKLPDQIALD